MASTHDLTIEQGAEFAERYSWQVGEQVQDLTDWTALAQVRTRYDGALLLDLTPYLTTSADSIDLRIPGTATRELVRGGSWDLFLIRHDSDGNETGAIRLLEGHVELVRAVTSVP